MKKAISNPLVGRDEEIKNLKLISESKQASIIVVHGRRRVGKTTLIEHAFSNRSILKIEGVEGGDKDRQLETALLLLARHGQDPAIAKLKFTRWLEFFDYLARFISKGVHTLYLEEVQWLASYQDELISDFKIIWDNQLRKNPNLLVVLCGSSPSFMVNHVLKSTALYGRSQHELHVQPFTFRETMEFFGKDHTPESVMDAHLSVGGIPEYLKYLRQGKSPYLALCNQAFRKDGYFTNECERVFVSSLAKNAHYRKIVEVLARNRFATRGDISKKLAIDSGGTLTTLLEDLEICGFIHAYVPFNRSDTGKLVRYEISDQYLQFYYRFIAPVKKNVLANAYSDDTTRALNLAAYQQWLGYGFERWCRAHHFLISKLLGFSSVKYNVGPYFSRKTEKHFQIDLIFARADRVLTICEIKYTKSPVSKTVIGDVERKLDHFPLPARHSIERVLISAAGADSSVKNAGFFDRILQLNDLV